MNKIVIIGASTGGPSALETLLPTIPLDFPYSLVVAQHLPAKFTQTFSIRVDKKCQLDLVEAHDGLPLVPGTIYLAPGNKTTKILKNSNELKYFNIVDSKDIESPSIDELMISASQIYGSNTIGVILTGMGKDGLLGMKAIKKAGGKTIVQDQETSAVFGMGKEIVDAGLADYVVPLNSILPTIYD